MRQKKKVRSEFNHSFIIGLRQDGRDFFDFIKAVFTLGLWR
jgi:hypothetical protein